MKRYFIPSEENQYKPHIFRGKSVTVLAIVIVGLFGLSVAMEHTLITRLNLTASVVSSVLVDLTNHDRQVNDRPPLRVNPLLIAAAQLKANDMAAKSYFAHTSPEGLTPWYWFKQVDYRFAYAGENLAVNFSDSADVVEAWMHSEGHRKNILNEMFTETGIAVATGTYNGKATVFVVQLFGTPSSAGGTVAVEQTMPGTPANQTTATNVAGAEAESEPNIPVRVQQSNIEHSSGFIAVKSTTESATKSEQYAKSAIDTSEQMPYATVTPTTTAQSVTVTPYHPSSVSDRALASPKKTLTLLYMILGALIIFALVLFIVIERKKQFPRHILYALLLLALIAVLLVAKEFVLPAVVVGEM